MMKEISLFFWYPPSLMPKRHAVQLPRSIASPLDVNAQSRNRNARQG